MNEADSRALHIHCSGTSSAQLLPADTPWTTGTRIHYAPLTKHLHQLEELHALLDPHERDRAARFVRQADHDRYVIGHGLLRSTLAQHTGIPAASIVFARGVYGKPVIPSADLHFNMSDTKDAVSLALHRTLPLGVDIETMQRSTDHERVGAHYFTAGEMEAIAAAPDAKRRFLEFWTRKEAILKACGVGIMDDLHTLRVDQAHNKLRIQHPAFRAMAAAAYHVHTWTVGNDHLVSLALPEPIGTVEITGFV